MIDLNKYLLIALLMLVGIASCKDGSLEAETGWPQDVDELIKHLNDWDVDELIAANEGGSPAPKTIEWVDRHLYELEKLSASIEWDSEKNVYVKRTE